MLTDRDHTPDLAHTLDLMARASNQFYAAAIQTDNHAFIEFTGLINEYIQLCVVARQQGIDFTKASTHTKVRLPIEDHQLAYIREKLECIYGLDVLAEAS